MSKMSELHIEIQEHIEDGILSFGRIAELYEDYGVTREIVEQIYNDMYGQDIGSVK